jgi:DNA-directed RNA polymerase subunit delta
MTNEQLTEESLIDLAYAILEERKSAMQFNDIITAIQALNGMSDEEIKGRMLQFYTDLNVEGRFLLNQENGWGLREWYKIETIEEETAPTVKSRKKKAKAVDEDEDIADLDEEEIGFEEDFEEFVDEDEEEIEEDLDFEEDDIEVLDADLEDGLIEDDSFIIEGDEEDEEEEDEDLK